MDEQALNYRPQYVKYRVRLCKAIAAVLLACTFCTNSLWANHPLLSGSLYAIGCGLVAFATIGRLWCSLYIVGYKTERLITDGPYSMTRNPLYFFSLFGGVGIGLVTHTLLIPLLIAVGYALYYPAVIRAEEARLLRIHGDAFTQYVQTTPVFWPKLARLVEPPEYTVNARFFRRSLRDAVWFVAFIGILELAAAARATGFLPVLFTSW